MVKIVSFNFKILVFVILILRSIVIRLFGAGRKIQKFSRVMRNIASGKRANRVEMGRELLTRRCAIAAKCVSKEFV